jgi:hypothetical protein
VDPRLLGQPPQVVDEGLEGERLRAGLLGRAGDELANPLLEAAALANHHEQVDVGVLPGRSSRARDP